MNNVQNNIFNVILGVSKNKTFSYLYLKKARGLNL